MLFNNFIKNALGSFEEPYNICNIGHKVANSKMQKK